MASTGIDIEGSQFNQSSVRMTAENGCLAEPACVWD